MINKGELSMDDLETWVKIEWPWVASNTRIIDWCNEYDGVGKYALGGHAVFFSHKEDAVIFSLRFS